MARGAIRVAFVIAALTVAHDIAGIRDPDAPYAIDDALVYRLFAASRAAMLAIAASLLADDERGSAPWLGIALVGLAANDDWFAYAPDDPFFWPAVVTDYGGVAVAFACFATYLAGGTRVPRGNGVAVAATVLGVTLFALGIALPVLTFGAYIEPALAERSNVAYWLAKIAICVGFVLVGARTLATRGTTTARPATTLAAFVVLGSGTVVHGLARVGNANRESWLPAGLDALGQCAFAALLAVSAFREPRPALVRALRWASLGGVLAALVPLAEDRLRERLVAWHLDRLGAFGGEENGRLAITVGSGLVFARFDAWFEAWRKTIWPQDAAPDATDAASADAATGAASAGAAPGAVSAGAASGAVSTGAETSLEAALVALTAEVGRLREAVDALRADLRASRPLARDPLSGAPADSQTPAPR